MNKQFIENNTRIFNFKEQKKKKKKPLQQKLNEKLMKVILEMCGRHSQSSSISRMRGRLPFSPPFIAAVPHE